MDDRTIDERIPTTTVAAARPVHGGLILATACLCQLMVVLDASVVNIALPSIDSTLGFSPNALSWVVNSYTVVFGGLLLFGGRLADLIGHRRTMLAGLGLFALASIIGGAATSPGQLIAARAAQGIAAAVLAPVSLTVIMVTFPQGPARNRAVGIWAMVAASGSAIGVLLGGLLTDLLNWRWVFYVNVPIAILTAALALRSIHNARTDPEDRPRRLDIVGAILGTAAVTLLVYATVRAGDIGWSAPATLVALVLAVVCGVLFTVWEQRFARTPLVRLGVFRVRTVWVANLVAVFIGAATIAGFYFASLFLQNILRYSPIQAGAAFVPFCVGIMVGALASSKLTARVGHRIMIGGGLLLTGVGMLLFSRLDVHATFLSGVLVPSLIASVGIGFAMVANTAMGTAGVADGEAGMVSGLLNTTRQSGGSIALAALSASSVAGVTAAGALAGSYDRAFWLTGVLLLAAAIVAAFAVPATHRN